MMYHHVQSDRCTNNLDIFEKHLEYISKNFTTVFPTFNETPNNSICLIFDDGYYDFYKYIFPLLKKYNLKALLAVVPSVILQNCDEDDNTRLNIEHNELFNNYKKGTFCTWEELDIMSKSNIIQIVSHSYSHKNLIEDDVDLQLELKTSKEMIEKQLNTEVESFVFPFGKYDQELLKKTKQYYKYSFRIGNAINKDFRGINGVIYRIDGDFLRSPSEIFNFKNMLKFRFKSFIKGFANG